MELPIRVIVVLMVALTVGMLIVIFSKNMLNNAQNDINNWAMQKENQDSIIEVESISNNALIGLAESCINKNYGESFEKTICFAIFTDNFNIDLNTLNNHQLPNNFSINASTLNGAAKIIYDPLGEIIIE